MSAAFVFRLLAWSFALLLLALPVVGVLNGTFASDRWPLRQLELEAELKQVSIEQVQGVVEAHTAQGFFALSLTKLRDALASVPWVESVEVRKRWPDTVVVRLLEYQPYAIWDDTHLVSRSGRLFQVPGIEAIGGLPRLSGPASELAAVVNFHARAATLLREARLHVTHVRLSSRGSWSLVLDGGAEVVLGREQETERLTRFAETIGSLMRERAATPLRHADLRYPNGFALTWASEAPPDGDTAPPAQAAPPPADPAAATPAPVAAHALRAPSRAAQEELHA